MCSKVTLQASQAETDFTTELAQTFSLACSELAQPFSLACRTGQTVPTYVCMYVCMYGEVVQKSTTAIM